MTNFRSVSDSGWVETDDVTALIGTNEAGKSNILLPLWKFNPAKEGVIVPTSDFPRKLYSTIRSQKPKPIFIRAVFEADTELASELSDLTGMPSELSRTVEVAKTLDGELEVDFPDATPPRAVPSHRVVDILRAAERDLGALTPMKTEEELKRSLLSALGTTIHAVPAGELAADDLGTILSALDAVKTESAPKKGSVVPRYEEASEAVRTIHSEVSLEHPRDISDAVDLVKDSLPKFVFYSTYGNLDSEIYLPHVIANLARTDLGLHQQAKVRTLKVVHGRDASTWGQADCLRLILAVDTLSSMCERPAVSPM